MRGVFWEKGYFLEFSNCFIMHLQIFLSLMQRIKRKLKILYYYNIKYVYNQFNFNNLKCG